VTGIIFPVRFNLLVCSLPVEENQTGRRCTSVSVYYCHNKNSNLSHNYAKIFQKTNELGKEFDVSLPKSGPIPSNCQGTFDMTGEEKVEGRKVNIITK
jgi:hypothetical protein